MKDSRGKQVPNATDPEIIKAIQILYPTQGAHSLAHLLHLTVSAVQNIAYRRGIKLEPNELKRRKGEPSRERMRGAGNPNWHGGITITEWGDNWNEQRKQALRRDHSMCQVCHSAARDVHHIIPRRYYIGHMQDANVLSNLITLCQKHHKLIECGKLICPIPKNTDN